MIRINTWITTAGDGLWSDVSRRVKLTSLSLPYLNSSRDFGELRAYFDIKTWNVNEDGLIYTDTQALSEFVDFLSSMGIDGSDVSYSEQGMQGTNYVSLDVGSNFIDSFISVFPEEFVEHAR